MTEGFLVDYAKTTHVVVTPSASQKETPQASDKTWVQLAPQDEAAVRFIVDLHNKNSDPNSPIDYIRPATYSFDWPIREAQLNRLQDLGLVEVKTYIRPASGQPDENVRQINILPTGMDLIRTKIIQHTVTTTTTDREILPDFEVREKRRNFLRTERGFGIMNSTLDDFLDAVKYHVMVVRSGHLNKKELAAHRIWLERALEFRGADIPTELKTEARDVRNTAFVWQRKRPKS